MTKDQELYLDVAEMIAKKWSGRGFRSYPYEDMLHDAYVAAATAAPNFDPEKGSSLKKYLSACAYMAVYLKVNRAISPVSTLSNDRVKDMSQTVQRADLDKVVPTLLSKQNMDDPVFASQVRKHTSKIVGDCPDKRTSLGILNGTISLRAHAGRDPRAECLLKNGVARMSRTLQGNKRLYGMYKELVCRP